MKIKHSKYKNTGILFELLVRQIASDTVSGKDSARLLLMTATPFTTNPFDLIKLESEGFEPEVLVGSEETLRRTKYISVDCGYEKFTQTGFVSTFKETHDFLGQKGFELLSLNKESCALFKNLRNIV